MPRCCFDGHEIRHKYCSSLRVRAQPPPRPVSLTLRALFLILFFLLYSLLLPPSPPPLRCRRRGAQGYLSYIMPRET
ncbi:hypothetical protein BV20DRAFT_242704 [Pilatotrama ljubarskyi]|nr:hypothetical protein BV20DRAFT_242704 [Pilatotrama ljubarskyi]